MTDGFDPDRHMDALAPALGLKIRAEWRTGIASFLAVAAEMAALVEAAQCETPEAAPVFQPGRSK